MAHSIAQYTGTRIDSSAKHIVACKVEHDLFTRVMGNDEKQLTDDKYRYAMQKDELVLDVGRYTSDPNPGPFRETPKLRAYPSVVTTLGDRPSDAMKTGIREHYRNLTPDGEEEAIAYAVNGAPRAFPYKFQIAGVALGTAYASDLTGDPVGSVLIGGMATVLNGHFPCYTGELVQWYFDFEMMEFTPDGFRKPPGADYGNNNIPVPIAGREGWYQKQMFAAYKENNYGKRNVALVKPYRPIRNANRTRGEHKYGDRVRVFGRVVNGGQSWEPIDIFICNVFV